MLINYLKSYFSARSRVVIFTLLLVMVGINTFLAMDMYVPSMPSLVHYFSSSATAIKLTITYYLAGLIFAPLVYGPLSDAYGRRRILIIGLLINLFAATLCVVATNLLIFNLGRFFQGAGVAVAIAIIRTMVRDRFSGLQYTTVASNISIVFSIGPAIAPALGGYLQHSYGWHSVFYTMIAYTLASIAAVIFVIPETNKNIDRNHMRLGVIVTNYKSIFSSVNFLTYALLSGFGIGIIIAFMSSSAFLIQNRLHYSAAYNGSIIMLIVLFSVLGKFCNSYLVKRVAVNRIVFVGLLITLFSGLLMMISYFTVGLTLAALVVTFIVYVFGFGLVSSNAMILSFSEFRHIAGAAGAAYSCLQMLLCFSVSLIVAHLTVVNQLPLSLVIIAISALSLAAFLLNKSAAVIS